MAISAGKSALRNEIKQRLKALTPDELDVRSSAIIRQLLSLPSFTKSAVVSCYLSMPNSEVRTSQIIKHCFESEPNKRLFVPKVIGKNSDDLRMFEVESEAQLYSFPKSNWGIPEPPLDVVLHNPDGRDAGIIDMVILPGVAFDSSCNRLGHGKGYYDCFLERLIAKNAVHGGPRPTLVGLGFDEQMIPSVPAELHDQVLDYIITPTAIYRKE